MDFDFDLDFDLDFDFDFDLDFDFDKFITLFIIKLIYFTTINYKKYNFVFELKH